jgi:SpoIIAA-like
VIQRLWDVPDGVLGFEAVGDVVAEDYETTVLPALHELKAAKGEARILYVIGDRLEHLSTGAMWADAKLEFEHLHWKRAAVVSNKDWVRHFVDALGWMVPGKVKSYRLEELDDAKTWVASDD